MKKEIDSNGPLWTKRSNFSYEINDPVTGGKYQINSKVELSQTQLFEKWVYVYHFCKKTRPEKGEIHILVF